MNPLLEEPKRRPRMGDTRHLPDHFAYCAFKCFDDICDAFERTNEFVTAGSFWREMLYIRMVGEEFNKFCNLYFAKPDYEPTLVNELIRHRAILTEIGLLS